MMMEIDPEAEEIIIDLAANYVVPVVEMERIVVQYGILMFTLPHEKRLELKKIIDDHYED